MSLFLVVGAVVESVTAIVEWTVTHEAVLQRLVPFLVPFEVPDHFFLLDEHPRVAVQAMEVLPRTKPVGKVHFPTIGLQPLGKRYIGNVTKI